MLTLHLSLAKIANDNGVPTINSFFDANVVQEICTRYGHADLITSHNALAHIDNLREVLPIFTHSLSLMVILYLRLVTFVLF